MGQEYLVHYGVKGMKWGKRKKSRDGPGPLRRIGDKRRAALTDKYIMDGFSKTEAAEKANKRIRTEKIVAGVAAAVVVGAVAYKARNYAKNEFTDRVLKSGTMTQTITADKNRDYSKPFYTAHTKVDKLKYKGMYSLQAANANDGKAFKVTFKANENIKVPSNKRAASIFNDLYAKDLGFKKHVDEVVSEGSIRAMGGTSKQSKMLRSQDPAKMYEQFNTMYAAHTPSSEVASKKFFTELKKHGYSAITDTNDTKYTGYKSKSPLIVFDTRAVTKTLVDEIPQKEILGKDLYLASLSVRGSKLLGGLGLIGASTYANKQYQLYNEYQQKEAIK